MSRTKIDPATLYTNFGAIQAHLAKVRELVADTSTHYHHRLMVALSAMQFVSELREALIKRDADLCNRTRTVTQSKFSGLVVGRANGDPREESFGRSTDDRLPTADAIANLRREVAEFREIANTLRLDAASTVSAAHALAWQSFAEVRKVHKPIAVTRELCSYLRAYIEPRKHDGKLPHQEKLCGLVERPSYDWAKSVKTVLRYARIALRNPTEAKKGSAPSLKAGRDIVKCPHTIGRSPRVGKYELADRQSGTFRYALPGVVSRLAGVGHYCLEVYFSARRNNSNDALQIFDQDHTPLLPLLRTENVSKQAKAGSRWVRMMQAKKIISTYVGCAQVIHSKPRELVTDGEQHAEVLGFEARASDLARLPAGHTLRVVSVFTMRYRKPQLSNAIILCGPDAAGVEWAHEVDLTPEAVGRVINRFIAQIEASKAEAERARVWNMSQAEKAKYKRKQMLTLACRMRALESISFEDSRRAGNCAPGTEFFMQQIGLAVSVRSVSGRKLAQLWRKAKYPSDSLLSMAVKQAETRAEAAAKQLEADRKLLAELEAPAPEASIHTTPAVSDPLLDLLNRIM